MRRTVALLLVFGMTACSKPADPPKDQVAVASAAVGAPLLCALTYRAERGAAVSESLAVVTLSLETGLQSGWRAERLTVTKPLETTDGFDPWAYFRSGGVTPFVSRIGTVATLATISGAPLTLDQATGEVNWRSDGILGAQTYTGVCS